MIYAMKCPRCKTDAHKKEHGSHYGCNGCGWTSESFSNSSVKKRRKWFKSMTYLDRLGDWIEKAGLLQGHITDPATGSRSLPIKGKKRLTISKEGWLKRNYAITGGRGSTRIVSTRFGTNRRNDSVYNITKFHHGKVTHYPHTTPEGKAKRVRQALFGKSLSIRDII